MPPVTVLRAVLLAACLLGAVFADTVELSEANVEGSVLPEELKSSPSAGTEFYDYDQAARLQQQREQQQLYVVEVDGRQATSGSTYPIGSSNEAVADPSIAADILTPGSDTAAEPGPDAATRGDSQLPLQTTEPEATIPAIPVVHTAAAVPQAAANPAANAVRVSAVPNMGVPPASSKIPGRYIVFFRDNVTSTQQGADRFAHIWLDILVSCKLPQLLPVLAAE
jgi:hypothetical protein